MYAISVKKSFFNSYLIEIGCKLVKVDAFLLFNKSIFALLFIEFVFFADLERERTFTFETNVKLNSSA